MDFPIQNFQIGEGIVLFIVVHVADLLGGLQSVAQFILKADPQMFGKIIRVGLKS